MRIAIRPRTVLHRRPARRRALGTGLAALLSLTMVVAIAALTPAPAQAVAGVPLPAEFGSEWVVIAGYNTTTHTAHDPDALDIVRTDAPTAGTVVRSPVAGTVRYSGGDCLSVRDASGLSHLLCHVFADAGIERGQSVGVGHRLGVVAPDGFAGNNGIAHIHYAVHQSGNGRTLSFTGAYALEGQNLFNSGVWNEHANRTFTSSNRASGSPFSGSPPPADASPNDDGPQPFGATAPEPLPSTVEALHPGWNLVSWPADAPLRETVAALGNRVRVVMAFDGNKQHYESYAADRPNAANTLGSVAEGAAVWVSVVNGARLGWPPANDPEAQPLSPRVSGGFNLVAWTNEARPVTEAIAPIAQFVRAVYTWDPTAQRFRVYRPGAPSFLNDLTVLRRGEGVWVEIRGGFSMEWSQR